MTFHLFDNVFLLHLPLEAPEGVFQGFTVLESYFSQNLRHLQTDHKLNNDSSAALSRRLSAKVLYHVGLSSKLKPSNFFDATANPADSQACQW
jgi:hypothetical protein